MTHDNPALLVARNMTEGAAAGNRRAGVVFDKPMGKLDFWMKFL